MKKGVGSEDRALGEGKGRLWMNEQQWMQRMMGIEGQGVMGVERWGGERKRDAAMRGIRESIRAGSR